jgi:mannose-6-phosphate isomerase-like protein (cupin superfamily)
VLLNTRFLCDGFHLYQPGLQHIPKRSVEKGREMMIVKKGSVGVIDFDGLQILDYTSNLESRSSFAVITVPPGTAHAESWSKRSDKYYYVVIGRVEFTLDGQLQVLSAGDFCVVPQGHHFSYLNRESKEAQICLVHTPCFDINSEVFIEKSDG